MFYILQSDSTIIFTRLLKSIFGSQPKIVLALVASTINSSISVGLKLFML